MVTKRQHYNPVMHLRRFAGTEPAGHIWTYDNQGGAARHGTAENTAVQTHFYSVERDDGTMDTGVEDYLSQIESAAAPVYDQLLAGVIPDKDSKERADFARFLACGYMRTPAMRKMAAEVAARELQILSFAYADSDAAFEGLNRRVEAEGGRVLTAEQKEELRRSMKDPSRFKMQVSAESTLHVLRGAEKLAPVLHTMNWMLVAPMGELFITCDNPVVRTVKPESVHPIYGDHGFLNKTIEVIFPLSPTAALVLGWAEDMDEFGICEAIAVDLVNRRLAANATRYLYASTKDERLTKLAVDSRRAGPSIVTEGYGPKRFAEVEVVRKLRGRP